MTTTKRFLFLVLMTAVGLGAASAQTELTGSGATFPEPLYRKMFDEYNKKTGVRVNYQGIGSGGGIKQLTDKVTDFGATDAYLSDAELKAAGAAIVHVPAAIGAVVVVYNLPGVGSGLKLTPAVIGGMFLGKIVKWNDPAIAAENKGTKLPDLAISVVHRSDSSGTSFVFTDYLAKANAEWKDKVGADKAPNWPAGIGGKGNPGVADLVRKIPGAVGYVELVYASQNKIAFADVKNKSGAYVTPSLTSASAAAAVSLPDDTRVSITDTPAKDGYPIATFTWLILFREQKYNERSRAKAQALVDLLWWTVHDGQQYSEALSYSRLDKSVVQKAEKLLRSVTYGGTALLK